ncbi:MULTISPECIES: TDT family transporter [unclassified Moritella]|uniref:TDT family transporter n=1 Tax=unclassified Moritella TaxID=2637987 RepID=UPI001BADB0A1|nr:MULTISPECIES: TDT family transporter [unclassified Moritella]QUM85928.1 TDT family transporter [Moritella sp. 28]QUM90159.1 TDT family transporter [Moritella sp. 36]
MLNQIRINFKLLPTPAAGLALGISSLGALWESVYDFNGYIQTATAVVAAAILFSLLLRFIIYPKTLLNDLSHHVVGSVVPTFAMATMVVSNSLITSSPALSTTIWLAAIVAHLVFLVVFLYHRVKDMQLQHMVPSWFVPPIGLIVAVFTCPQPEKFESLCYAILVFGIVNYALLLPVMLNRLIFGEKIQAGAKPSIAILAAPASLCLTGYLAFVSEPSPIIVAVLLGIAVLMTMVIYMALLHLSRLTFHPGFAAFTFPLVISAKALYSIGDWLEKVGISEHYISQLHVVALFELGGATVVVAWVSACYIKCLVVKLQNMYIAHKTQIAVTV